MDQANDAASRTLTIVRTDLGREIISRMIDQGVIEARPGDSDPGAIALMRKHKISCLPVVRDGKLVGIVTEHDFFGISATLLERWLKNE